MLSQVDDMRRLVNNAELSDIEFIVEGRTVFASKVRSRIDILNPVNGSTGSIS